MKRSLGICNFLEEISSLSHSIVPSISLQWSLRKAFLSLLPILWNSAFKWKYLSFSLFHFSFHSFARPPQTAILLFCIFSWGWSWSLSPVQCHEPHSVVHQALLSIRSRPLNLFLISTVPPSCLKLLSQLAHQQPLALHSLLRTIYKLSGTKDLSASVGIF